MKNQLLNSVANSLKAKATPQIQSNWNQADETALDFIKNKPDITGGASGNNLLIWKSGVLFSEFYAKNIDLLSCKRKSIIFLETGVNGENDFTINGGTYVNVEKWDFIGSSIFHSVIFTESVFFDGMPSFYKIYVQVKSNVSVIPLSGAAISFKTSETSIQNLGGYFEFGNEFYIKMYETSAINPSVIKSSFSFNIECYNSSVQRFLTDDSIPNGGIVLNFSANVPMYFDDVFGNIIEQDSSRDLINLYNESITWLDVFKAIGVDNNFNYDKATGNISGILNSSTTKILFTSPRRFQYGRSIRFQLKFTNNSKAYIMTVSAQESDDNGQASGVKIISTTEINGNGYVLGNIPCMNTLFEMLSITFDESISIPENTQFTGKFWIE